MVNVMTQLADMSATALILATVAMSVLVVRAVPVVMRIWRGDASTVSHLAKGLSTWFPVSQGIASDLVRAAPIVAAGTTLVALGVIAAEAILLLDNEGNGHPSSYHWCMRTALIGAALILIVQPAIVLFNQPSILVPPSLREHAGLFPRLLRRLLRVR